MSLPLPVDPDFRKAVVGFWLDDIDDRLSANRMKDAEESWRQANSLYMSLPPGCGNMELEDRLFEQRVKLDKLSNATNAHSL